MSEGDGSGRAFRDALGSFPTGVTIATTVDEAGEPVGVTASSFNSVSVNPPLVLWSLARDSRSARAFATSGHFAVHVLASSQEELSNRFASSGADKFAGMNWHAGQLGSPVFDAHAALFECRTRHQYDGGDHVIMVGEVIAFETRDEAPLLFHAGRYAESRPRTRDPQALDDDALNRELANALVAVAAVSGGSPEAGGPSAVDLLGTGDARRLLELLGRLTEGQSRR